MVPLSTSPALSRTENLVLYHTTDTSLSEAQILVFLGPAQATGTSSLASSRIQSHVFSPVGFQSYSRLAISPGSPLYAAVNCLSRQDQGDEVCRALAYTLLKYFNELPESVKELWVKQHTSRQDRGAVLGMFGEAHAARLASQMRKAPDTLKAAKQLETDLTAHSLSAIDIDIIVPKDSFRPPHGDDGDTSVKYGPYTDIVSLFGEPTFIPNSKLRRAPSRPMASSKSIAFPKQQREALRREICELLDTEENYVFKLNQFVKDVVYEFRNKCKVSINRPKDSDQKAIAKLFPASLDRILSTNSSFFRDLLAVVESTEADAIDDIEKSNASSVLDGCSVDPTGSAIVADCLLQYIPAFRECYSQYIAAHADFGGILKSLANTRDSAFHDMIAETGEQKLLSLLIEPVQRLPRYSLYLENILKQLPARHMALASLLKAKDQVAELCVQGSPVIHAQSSDESLRLLVHSWPSNFPGTSRLITAVDAVEHTCGDGQGAEYVAILFTSHLALCSKRSTKALSAHGLVAEIEAAASAMSTVTLSASEEPSLIFEDCMSLAEVAVFEAANGCDLRLVPLANGGKDRTGPLPARVRQFKLTGAYAERAVRFTRELARARAEGRFPEQVRESHKWEVRETESDSPTGLVLTSVVFEEGLDSKHGAVAASVRVALNSTDTPVQVPASGTASDILVSITCEGDGFYRLEVGSLLAQTTKDCVTSAEFMPVLQKRLAALLQIHSSMRNVAIADALLKHHQQILLSLRLPQVGHARSLSRPKVSRPHSPVKALTNLFGGTTKESGSTKKAPLPAPTLNDIPALRPQLGPKANSESGVAKASDADLKVVMVRGSDANGDAIAHLESCLRTYLLALRARKGNVVGRIISGRAGADNTEVRQLVTAIDQHPEGHEVAANSSVDVLFAAFEVFIKTAWEEHLGSIIGIPILDELQYKSTVLSPFEYEDYLQMKLDDLAPQNRRAFRGILETFMDLLGGMSNDGDRGTLMATMTEIVVSEGRPHDYMSIFDRFIEEHDTILHSITRSGSRTPYPGSLASSAANHSIHTSSISSKASSLGRRFGLTSTTEGSKPVDSRLGSVFRSISKANKAVDGSLRDRNGLGRPKSTEFSAQASSSRPQSREGLSFVGSTGTLSSRPGTAHSGRSMPTQDSPTQVIPEPKPSPRRKKRRSSLSDLEVLPLPNTSPFWDSGTPSLRRPVAENSPIAPRVTKGIREVMHQNVSLEAKPLGSTPLRHAVTVAGTPSRRPQGLSGPARHNTVSEHPSDKKENVPPSTPDQSERGALHSPAKGVLAERTGYGNVEPPPVFDISSSKGLHAQASNTRRRAIGQQSPHKLRERVRAQQTAVSSADRTLRDELAKIGDELLALNLPNSSAQATSNRPEGMSEGVCTPRKTSATLQNISGRLKALEARVPHMVSSLTRQADGLQQDISAFQNSEVQEKSDIRIRELEAQVQLARDEHHLLTRQHEEEIRRLYEQHRRGRQQSEMERKMCDAMDESAKCREEMAALQRENADLRAQLQRQR